MSGRSELVILAGAILVFAGVFAGGWIQDGSTCVKRSTSVPSSEEFTETRCTQQLGDVAAVTALLVGAAGLAVLVLGLIRWLATPDA